MSRPLPRALDEREARVQGVKQQKKNKHDFGRFSSFLLDDADYPIIIGTAAASACDSQVTGHHDDEMMIYYYQ